MDEMGALLTVGVRRYVGGRKAHISPHPSYQFKVGLPGARTVKRVLKRCQCACGWSAAGASPNLATPSALAFSPHTTPGFHDPHPPYLPRYHIHRRRLRPLCGSSLPSLFTRSLIMPVLDASNTSYFPS